MQSPFEGRLTQNYDRGDHAGIDIAPPTPGTVGTPVFASFAGTVDRVVTGRAPGQSPYDGRVLAPLRSGNGAVVRNPDGERQVYNHVRPVVTTGERVAAGELIGYTDESGIQTGPHLHFETWNSAGRTYDPLVLFHKYGVTVGSAPAGAADVELAEDGSAEVAAYQRRQNTYGAAGLVVDGLAGPVTSAWRAWTEQLQRELPAWKGIGDLVIDGDYGPVTHRAVATLQRRNHLVVDGIAGPVTIRYMRAHGSEVDDRPPNRP